MGHGKREDATPPSARRSRARPVGGASLAELLREGYRLRLLRALEAELQLAGYPLIAGVDEAGRGCLAGPVVAAAVLVDPAVVVPGVDDSKVLTPAHRERLARAVRKSTLACSVAAVPAAAIDRMNILEATRRAMRQALEGLRPAPDCALIDAVRLEGLGFPCLSLVRADTISYPVACASLVAKVERDRMMRAYDSEFPFYGFASNKGYGAPEHLRALEERGPTPIHRLTFRSVLPRAAECRR